MSAACVSTALDQLESDILAVMRDRSPAWLRSQLANGAYVYGAGNFGRRIARQMVQAGLPCLGMIDRRAGADLASIEGLPVLRPDAITPEIAAGKVFVLGILNPHNDMGELVRLGQSYGFEHVFWGADIVDALGASIGDFWLNERQFFIDHFEQVRALASLLGDAVSVETLLSILRFRVIGGNAPQSPVLSRKMYLPDDLPGFDAPISFLDGGAYDGDTFRGLVKAGVSINRWMAFEPDAANFEKLAQFGESCGAQATFMPCGLSDSMHQVSFATGNEQGSRIVGGHEPGGESIQCVAVDKVFHGIPVDYVKLDIEGAEAAALRGMRQTIRQNNARLAISVYHRPEDIWALPFQIRDILPDADIFLRQHEKNTFEVVAYAIPCPRKI